MDRAIPYVFDCVVCSSPLESISEDLPNVGRCNVRVFTKYKNRNGSYISDAIADKLIATAYDKPVVGFFDRETGDWTTHVGPQLANAYGYVDYFVGWQPFTDTDGVERDYAVFSVVLFSEYFEEAKTILGKAQSMEIEPTSIEGDWMQFDDDWYFVYTNAKMKGFCVLGDNTEPCFSVSAFFNKQEEGSAETNFDKFARLLVELREKVDKATKKEGEKMALNVSCIENEHYNALFDLVNPDYNEEHNFAVAQIVYEINDDTFKAFDCTTGDRLVYNYSVGEVDGQQTISYGLADEQELGEEAWATKYAEAQQTAEANYAQVVSEKEAAEANFNQANADLEVARTTNAEITSNYEELQNSYNAAQATITSLNEKISGFEAQFAAIETEKKEKLIASYEKVLPEDDINNIKGNVSDFSYDELEGKLALAFARKNVALDNSTVRIPNGNPNPQMSQFELLMQKYKK